MVRTDKWGARARRPARRRSAAALLGKGRLRGDEGFSTAGMAVALLVTVSLVFSAAQVYRVSSASADIQETADAAALAAENEVAEFMVAAQACDAAVLSLSLTGLSAYGLGTVALCAPPAAPVGQQLIELGGKVLDARDAFAQKASEGLDALQRALPALAAANAASVAAENGGPLDERAAALAVLVPCEGVPLSLASGSDEEGRARAGVEDGADDLRQAAEEAERAADRALAAKERGFQSDCGAVPGYCLFERADTLAHLPPQDNPLYASPDAWSFSVALERARSYYAARLAQEVPLGTSVEEQAESALRATLYAYAVREMATGYVHEAEDSFEAFFPRLPRNTDEMRATELYTDAAFPLSAGASGPMLHAWPGCPGVAGPLGKGSLAQMEQGGFAVCPHCRLTAASLGRVAAASSSIENGFEYHYRAVADAAEEYEAARAVLDPAARAAKERAQGMLDRLKEALRTVAGQRIHPLPPGSDGAIALTADAASLAADAGLESSFVENSPSLGARAAVSGATLLSEGSDEGQTVLTSLLDGLRCEGGWGLRRGAHRPRRLVRPARRLCARAGGARGVRRPRD